MTVPTCDGCGKMLGFEYIRSCDNCDRTYCEACLAKDPNYSADAEMLGDPPRWVDTSSLEVCLKCAPRANANTQQPAQTADESHNKKEGKE